MRMALTGDGDFGFAVLKLGFEPSYDGIPSKEDGYEDDHTSPGGGMIIPAMKVAAATIARAIATHAWGVKALIFDMIL